MDKVISASVSISGVSLGPIDVTADTYGGLLRVTAVLNDIDVDGSIGGTFSSGFDLTADSITVQVLLDPSVDWGGNIRMDLYSTTVTVSGMVFEASGGAGVLAVGDGLATDIKGALAAGIDSLLVTSGLLAEELDASRLNAPTPDLLAALCDAAEVHPSAAIPALRW